ncbi:hypothetical protein Tco_0579993, partial [Tanacetum coccineum]
MSRCTRIRWTAHDSRGPLCICGEFMPFEDDVLPTVEQPLPAAVSPTGDSL